MNDNVSATLTHLHLCFDVLQVSCGVFTIAIYQLASNHWGESGGVRGAGTPACNDESLKSSGFHLSKDYEFESQLNGRMFC